jgi:hypothetical protein
MWEGAKIIAFSVFCAVIYGVLHDQVTAHVAVEYFTIAHPPVFPTQDPFWLAMGWGVIATWWMGVILGASLAVSARMGRWPKASLRDVRRPIILLMAISGALAMSFGALGWAITDLRVPGTIDFWANEIDPSRHARFAFAAWAHSVSYLVGAIGGLMICVRILARRRALACAKA